MPDAAQPRDSNTERIVAVAAACLGRGADDPVVVRALRKGRGAMADRDRLFHNAADAQPAIRAGILAAQPSLAALVAALAALVGPALAADPR